MACGAPHTGAVRAWSEAWDEALYGPSGFFRRSAPLDHFRTNVAVPLFAVAVRRLAGLVDAALGFPDPFDLVDVGAGRGELLCSLRDVPSRWRLTGVDVAERPEGPIRWTHEIPHVTGLLFANEWLDSVPLDVIEDGRLVLVAPDGTESLGAPMSSEWASAWWPGPAGLDVPHRVEIGASRDLAWAAAVARVRRGLAVAVDYGHTTADRRPTLTGYQEGRQVLPVPDGSCDLTAHVALDACAAATGSRVVRQREALQFLGISAALPAIEEPGSASERPPGGSRSHDPAATAYPVLLEQASQARELLDPAGLGGFGWLLRPVDVTVGWMGV
jgi:SAM-dependent MidA family methyltransferase